MAVDNQQFLLQTLASLLGGILGVSLGAWLTGLYKIKGEITGRSEKIDEILAEIRETTKATESVKIATRLEQLEQILPEVRAVTETQKRIETRVAGGEWDRQWRLNQMRDAYGRLLAAVYGLQDYFNVAGHFDWNSVDESDPDAREAYLL